MKNETTFESSNIPELWSRAVTTAPSHSRSRLGDPPAAQQVVWRGTGEGEVGVARCQFAPAKLSDDSEASQGVQLEPLGSYARLFETWKCL